MILSFSYSSTANGLSARTANVIHGTVPYLTFNNGATKVTTTEDLVGITLSDGTAYTHTNSSTSSNPIELPVAGQSMADVGMLVPTTVNSVSLSALIGSPYNYWGDDEGDGQGVGGISATGTLSVAITDVEGNTVARNSSLSACNSPYKVVLTSTSGNLKTQYGTPNITPFSASSATYYIKPKIVAPYVCFAQPNLKWGTGIYLGPASQWDPVKGFKVQDVNTPSSNFPTTGSNNLYFNLTVAGALGSDVTYSKSPSTSGIDLTITGSGNVAKVVLTGPAHGSWGGEAETAVPTTFTLYSDAAKTNVIYSFTISQWFIARLTGISYPDTQTYCSNYLGYRVPKRTDYTNSIHATGTGYGGNYKRAIGGGLFAEWGYTLNTYYTGSDWEMSIHAAHSSYWTSEPKDATLHYIVFSDNGQVHTFLPEGSTIYRGACVSP